MRGSAVLLAPKSPIAAWLSMAASSNNNRGGVLHRPHVATFSRASCTAGSFSENNAHHHQKRYFGSQQTDYYRVLGVKNDATHDEIKAAYKKLALEFHPDRNTAAGAEERFKQISEAYSVVGNKTKRKDYDASRVFGNPGFASSQGSGPSSSKPQSSSSYANYGPGFGQTFNQGNPFAQQSGQQMRSEQMSRDEANRLFRDLFGGMQVDQIFREFDNSMNHRRSMGSGNGGSAQSAFQSRIREFPAGQATFRPFFREEKSNVFTDEFGNRTEERTFTAANGTRYTVRNTTSGQEGASTNQTNDEYYRNAANQRMSQDGRASFGTSSFRVHQKARDFGSFLGVRTHGRHPLVGAAIIVAWAIVITTVFFGIINFALSHPLFLGALVMLYLARKGRFG